MDIGPILQHYLQPCVWFCLLCGSSGWTLDLVHYLALPGTVNGPCYYRHAACHVQTLWECALMSGGASSVVVTFGSWLVISCGAALLLLISYR